MKVARTGEETPAKLKKRSLRISQIIVYTMCYSYTLASVLNDGFTGPYMGTPFIIFLLSDTIEGSISFRTRVINIFFISFCVLIYFSDRSSWIPVYPSVGDKIIAERDITVYHNKFYPNELDFLRFKEDSPEPSFLIKAGNHFEITNQYKSGNADLGINYLFKISPSNNDFKDLYLESARSITKNIHSFGENYEELDLEGIYIDLRDLTYKPDHKKEWARIESNHLKVIFEITSTFFSI
ncbi:MAG: hypothetical protein ACLGHN_15880, partial [Bacteriovoracia bacterium]